MPPKPLTFTPEQVEQVRKLAAVLSREQIADFFGIHVNTLDNVRQRQPEVDVAYKMGLAKAISEVGNSLLQDALDGDTTSRIFYLKTRAGWRETNRVDHTSSDGSMTPKGSLDLSNVPSDALKALVEAADGQSDD